MIWLIGFLALAASPEAEVVVVEGALHPAEPARILVAAVGADGKPVAPDAVQVDAGTLLLEADPRGPLGISRFTYTPPPRAQEVQFTVDVGGESILLRRPVVEAVPSRLAVPSRVTALSGRAAQFVVASEGLRVEDLDVQTGEPAGVKLEQGDGVVRVRLQPTGQGARVLLVGVRDRRVDGPARLVRVSVRQRHDKSFELEPGASLTVRVGERSYGPFAAEADGRVAASWEQKPGEGQAVLEASDDLGNRTQSAYPMAALEPSPLLVASGEPWPGDLPPAVVLHGARADGAPVSSGRPRCRAPGTGQLVTHRMAAGRWVVALPLRPVGGLDLRISCELGSGRTTLRVPAPVGRPHRLILRAWPEDLSTDFPVSEVTAHLEDVRGDRLPSDGLEVTADRGVVVLESIDGPSRRGEYQGGLDAVRQGYDTIRAVWRASPGSGLVRRVVVSRGARNADGHVVVHGRALDGSGRPLDGVPLTLGLGASSAIVPSGKDGWASATLDPGGRELLQLWALARDQQRWALRHASGPVDPTGPGLADLETHASVRLSAGRVSTVKLDLDTPVLFTGPTASLRVRVYLYDRAENLVTDEIPVLTVSAGNVGPPRRLPDGGYEAVYQPPPGGRAQTVSIIARSPTGSASGTQELRLEPRPVIAAVGMGVGAVSNLSPTGINAVLFTVDAEQRLPAFNDQLMARLGIAGYTTARTVEVPVGDEVIEVRRRLTLLPVTAAALARQDWGRNATWLGLGVTLAPYASQQQFEAAPPAASVGVLPPGFSAMLGAGRRFGDSEVILEVRGTFLASPGGPSGYQGQVGGIGLILGIRRVID